MFAYEKINLASVCVRFPTPPKDEDETYSKPRLLKLFCNHEDLDFSDIEEIPASAKCILEDEDATEAKITCIGHKFQRLSSLQLLVEESMDPEATRSFVNRISLVGHKVFGTRGMRESTFLSRPNPTMQSTLDEVELRDARDGNAECEKPKAPRGVKI
eukprot:s558_g30.t1